MPVKVVKETDLDMSSVVVSEEGKVSTVPVTLQPLDLRKVIKPGHILAEKEVRTCVPNSDGTFTIDKTALLRNFPAKAGWKLKPDLVYLAYDETVLPDISYVNSDEDGITIGLRTEPRGAKVITSYSINYADGGNRVDIAKTLLNIDRREGSYGSYNNANDLKAVLGDVDITNLEDADALIVSRGDNDAAGGIGGTGYVAIRDSYATGIIGYPFDNITFEGEVSVTYDGTNVLVSNPAGTATDVYIVDGAQLGDLTTQSAEQVSVQHQIPAVTHTLPIDNDRAIKLRPVTTVKKVIQYEDGVIDYTGTVDVDSAQVPYSFDFSYTLIETPLPITVGSYIQEYQTPYYYIKHTTRDGHSGDSHIHDVLGLEYLDVPIKENISTKYGMDYYYRSNINNITAYPTSTGYDNHSVRNVGAIPIDLELDYFAEDLQSYTGSKPYDSYVINSVVEGLATYEAALIVYEFKGFTALWDSFVEKLKADRSYFAIAKDLDSLKALFNGKVDIVEEGGKFYWRVGDVVSCEVVQDGVFWKRGEVKIVPHIINGPVYSSTRVDKFKPLIMSTSSDASTVINLPTRYGGNEFILLLQQELDISQFQYNVGEGTFNITSARDALMSNSKYNRWLMENCGLYAYNISINNRSTRDTNEITYDHNGFSLVLNVT